MNHHISEHGRRVNLDTQSQPVNATSRCKSSKADTVSGGRLNRSAIPYSGIRRGYLGLCAGVVLGDRHEGRQFCAAQLRWVTAGRLADISHRDALRIAVEIRNRGLPLMCDDLPHVPDWRGHVSPIKCLSMQQILQDRRGACDGRRTRYARRS